MQAQQLQDSLVIRGLAVGEGRHSLVFRELAIRYFGCPRIASETLYTTAASREKESDEKVMRYKVIREKVTRYNAG